MECQGVGRRYHLLQRYTLHRSHVLRRTQAHTAEGGSCIVALNGAWRIVGGPEAGQQRLLGSSQLFRGDPAFSAGIQLPENFLPGLLLPVKSMPAETFMMPLVP